MNSAWLQKAYLCNRVKKHNKLLIKNTAAWLCKVKSMLMHFPVPQNTPMADDKLCNIIYHMQIKLLNGVKQKSKTIVVDNNYDERKKSSSHCKKNVNIGDNAKSHKPKGSYNAKRSRKYCMLCKQFRGNPTTHNTKDCRTVMVTSRKCPASDHMT
eukprot:5362062-Ditylum_brightwellii.AAC.1